MACSYDEDVCSNEFKLLCGENVRTGRQRHASMRATVRQLRLDAAGFFSPSASHPNASVGPRGSQPPNRSRPGNVCGRSLQQPRQGLARTPRRRRSSWSRQRADPCRPIAPLALIAAWISDACAWRWCGPCCYVNGSLAHARRRRRQACGSSSMETAASSMSSKYYGLPPPGPARCHLRRTLIASATRRSTAPKLRRSGCGS